MKILRFRIATVAVLCILLAPAAVAEQILVAKVYRDYPGYIEPPTCANPRLSKSNQKPKSSTPDKTVALTQQKPVKKSKIYRNYPGFIETPLCTNPRFSADYDEEAIARKRSSHKEEDKLLVKIDNPKVIQEDIDSLVHEITLQDEPIQSMDVLPDQSAQDSFDLTTGVVVDQAESVAEQENKGSETLLAQDSSLDASHNPSGVVEPLPLQPEEVEPLQVAEHLAPPKPQDAEQSLPSDISPSKPVANNQEDIPPLLTVQPSNDKNVSPRNLEPKTDALSLNIIQDQGEVLISQEELEALMAVELEAQRSVAQNNHEDWLAVEIEEKRLLAIEEAAEALSLKNNINDGVFFTSSQEAVFSKSELEALQAVELEAQRSAIEDLSLKQMTPAEIEQERLKAVEKAAEQFNDEQMVEKELERENSDNNHKANHVLASADKTSADLLTAAAIADQKQENQNTNDAAHINYYGGLWAGFLKADAENVTPSSLSFDFDKSTGFGLLLGCALDAWRFDVEGSYLKSSLEEISFNSTVSSSESGNLVQKNLLINGYYQFSHGNKISPYIGAGVGISEMNFEDIVADGNLVLDDKDTVLLGQLSVGTLIALTEKIDLNIGYRYLHSEKAELKSLVGQVETEVASHMVTAGIQYIF